MTKHEFENLKTGDLLLRIIPLLKRSDNDNLFMFTKRQKVQLASCHDPYYIIYHFDFYVGTITKLELYKPWQYYDKA